MKTGAATLLVAAVSLLNAACAGAKQATPKQPPPTVPGVSSAPPPAWIETRRGDYWLAFTSYCWVGTCVDFRPNDQRTDIPRISVTRGDVVHFHLRFEPSKLWMKMGLRQYPLSAQRIASWRVRGKSGFAELHALENGLRAEYVARLVIR